MTIPNNGHIKVVLPVTDLSRDGAQRQLYELVKGLDKTRFSPVVIALHANGAMEEDFRSLPEVKLVNVNWKGKMDIGGVKRLFTSIRDEKADVIQPFLTPATFFSLLAAFFYRVPGKIVTERLADRTLAFGTTVYRKLEDILSRFVDKVIPNSRAGEESLIKRGIDPSLIEVINNGLNLNRMTYNEKNVQSIRQQLGVSSDGAIVGMMARMHRQKDHATFLKAAAIISRAANSVRFALLGDGPLRPDLENLSRELGIDSKTFFLGEHSEVGDYLAAFDVVVHTTESEGCSNSLLEAMVLGKPVVATDIEGNRGLITPEDTGILVPPKDAEATARAVIKIIENPDYAKSLGERARAEITSRYDLHKMVKKYEEVYENLTENKSVAKGAAISGY